MLKKNFDHFNERHDIVLSLIVTTYNRPKELQRFLDSISNQQYKHKFEIILINQGSPDINIKRLFEQSDWQLIECNSQIPLSVARNKGMEIYRGKLIGFPDDDCWYPPGFIDGIIEKFDQYELYEAICVSVFDPIQNKTYGKRPIDLCCDLNFKNVIQLPVSVGIFVRTAIIKKIALRFNETLGAGTFYGGGEETAFVCSVLKSGARVIYDGSLSVYHELDDYSQISLEKVKKYSMGYGYIAGSILVDKRYEAIPSFLYFIIKSVAALLIRSYKKRYRNIYSTRLEFFFLGIFEAFKNENNIF